MVIIAVTAIFYCSCATTSTVTGPKDVSYIYNPTKNSIIPVITLYHIGAEETVMTVSIKKNQLFFSLANPTNEMMASVNVSVRLFDNSLGGMLCDSAAYSFDIKQDPSQPEFICRVPLKAYEGGSYYAEVKVFDKIKRKSAGSFISFRKTGPYDAYNYRLYSHFGKREMFTRNLHTDEFVNVRYLPANIDTIWLFYYKPVTKISPAPSVILPEVTTSDTADRIIPIAYTDTLPLMFPREGIYLFSPDSTINQGITLFNFGADFPGMTKAETMIPPLAYIATDDEMAAFNDAPNKKVALDNFWMDKAGNIDKAKELIRIYYFRVQYSNLYFSSYKSGWLTDRGMVYVVYGPPDKLFKTSDTERWGYKLPPVKKGWGKRFPMEDQYLWFTFRKQDNMFTENDFTLSRSQTPVSYWDQAVASWRRGKVFRLDNPKEFQ